MVTLNNLRVQMGGQPVLPHRMAYINFVKVKLSLTEEADEYFIRREDWEKFKPIYWFTVDVKIGEKNVSFSSSNLLDIGAYLINQMNNNKVFKYKLINKPNKNDFLFIKGQKRIGFKPMDSEISYIDEVFCEKKFLAIVC